MIHLFTDPVFLVEMAMLASLLAVGFYTSCTDLKARWVPNRYTLALLGIGLIGQTAMVALGRGPRSAASAPCSGPACWLRSG